MVATESPAVPDVVHGDRNLSPGASLLARVYGISGSSVTYVSHVGDDGTIVKGRRHLSPDSRRGRSRVIDDN